MTIDPRLDIFVELLILSKVGKFETKDELDARRKALSEHQF